MKPPVKPPVKAPAKAPASRSVIRVVLGICLGLTLQKAAIGMPHQSPGSSQALDQQMAATLQTLREGNLNEARVLARQMALSFPGSALAQLLAAEFNAMAAQKDVLAAGVEPMSQPLMALLLEARARLQQQALLRDGDRPDGLPADVIQLGRGVSALLVVDLADSSLHHFAVTEGQPALMRQHYISSGKAGFGKQTEGDNKTPLGIYSITGQRSDASLPDLYGAGALTLDYPNALDQHLGRTGSGIWLHGVPHNQRNRPPRSSEGCVTMSNDHFSILQQQLSDNRYGRPLVLLTHSSTRHDLHRKLAEKAMFRKLFMRYRRARLSGDAALLSSLFETAPDTPHDTPHDTAYTIPDASLQAAGQIKLHDAADPLSLHSVDSDDISIFHNPALRTGKAPMDRPIVVMQALAGPLNEYQLTLYWRLSDTGQWRVAVEAWQALD